MIYFAMDSLTNKKYIGFFLILLVISFTVVISASKQTQNENARASQSPVKVLTGSGTRGRNPSEAKINRYKANAVIPIPQLDTYPVPPLTRSDIYNLLLGGTKGGTTSAGVQNSQEYMEPNSRLRTAGQNEYNAVAAVIYYDQIKGHIAYRDVVYNFPDDSINDIADSIASGSAVQLRTQEADILLKVAVIYKGIMCGFGEYNNPALKQLLVKWGRTDLAGEVGVGETDIESIGLTAQAIDEQPDPQIRREWLSEIYSFSDNLHPQSPSGAVPQLREYQCSVDLSQDGTIDRLIDNYVKGVQTAYNLIPTPGGLGYPFLAPGGPVTPTFSCLGGPCPTPTGVDVSEEPTEAPDPTDQPVVPTAVPQAPAPSTGILQLIIQLLLTFILAIFGRG
jgi:hypothetical protein